MGALQSCLNSRCRSILFGSTSAASTPPMIEAGKKEYSWDRRRRETDLGRFTIENVAAGEVGRMPGDIAGDHFRGQVTRFGCIVVDNYFDEQN